MFSLSLFANIRQRVSTDINALKTDVRAAEVRIEEAFNLGVVAQTLQSIEASGLSIGQKLQEAFSLGRSHALVSAVPVVTETTAPAVETPQAP